VERANRSQNKKTITEYGFNTTYFNVFPKKQRVTNFSGSTSISTVTFNNNNLILGGRRIFPHVSQQTMTDHLTGLSVTTNYEYRVSDDGNPWRITETRGNLITEITNTWEARGSSFKNRLTNRTVTRRGLQGTFTEIIGFEYDNKGRLIWQKNFVDNPKAITTIYNNFDNFGNPQNTTTSATHCPTVNITIGYNQYGRAAFRTDAVGTTYTSYDIFGRITSITGVSGLTTQYRYDGFGNLIEIKKPTSTITYTSAWDINHSPIRLYRVDRTETGSPSQSVWYNAEGLAVKTRTRGFSGNIYTLNTYDSRGRLFRSFLPEYGAPSATFTEFTYDALGRLTSEISIAGTTTHSYNGLGHTIAFPDGTFRTTTLNSAGLIASVADGGGTINYTYNSLGKPITITAVGLTTHIGYDNRGFQTSLKDPNMEVPILFDYDAYGLLRSQINARGDATTFVYDAAGRIVSEISPEMSLTFNYATFGAGKGQLEFIKSGNTILRKIEYNPLGLPEQMTENVDGTDFVTKYLYDDLGRIEQTESPSGFMLFYQYCENYGFLTTLHNGTKSAPLWRADEANALGQITSSRLGNGLTRNTVFYHRTFMLESITLNDGASKLDEIIYNFIPSSGNLQQRNDMSNVRNEVFNFDHLNRLNSISLNSATPKSISYTPSGNITNKFDVGTYLYANNHAVAGIFRPVPEYSPLKIDLKHTSFNRTSQITQGNQKLTFGYSPSKRRNVSRYHVDNILQTTRYYIGNYEKKVTENATKEFDYIYSPEGLIAIVVTTENARTLYYAHTDHLGSLRLLTDIYKTVQSRYHYDAWGQRTLVAGNHITNRGFTMHEHLDEFGLINMNARMYDPVLARFLSLDPYVPDATFSQDFNRYSYVRNNPLSYVDPTGEILVPLWLLFTKSGYNAQKAVSPVAVNVDFRRGSNQGGIGFNVSDGLPTLFHTSYRANYGATYFWKYNDLMGNDMSGWEARRGGEWSFMAGRFTFGGTTYNSGWSEEQSTNYFMLRLPRKTLFYENDMPFMKVPGVPKGTGDEYRTASARIRFAGGLFEVGTQMITGNAGFGTRNDRGNFYIDENGNKIYNGGNNGYNPNSHRMGVLYFRAGPLAFGKNSERIRHVFQNRFAHDFITGGETGWFEVLDLKPRWFWQFGGPLW
jgi:RHS repeat-associated protein